MKLPHPGASAGVSAIGAPSSPPLPRGRPDRTINDPRAGYFTVKLVKGGPRVAARIHMDRGGFWAEIDGKRCGAMHEEPLQADGVMRIWLYGNEIDRAEYEQMLASTNRPDPRKPINLRTQRSIY